MANAIPAASTVTLANALTGGTATLDLAGHNQTLSTPLTFGGMTTGPGSFGQVIDSVGGGTLTVNGGVTYNCNGNPQPALISALLSLGTTSRRSRSTTTRASCPAPI